MQKYLFLVLIIYLGFSNQLLAQNLELKIYGLNNSETAIIDSLNYEISHKDYLSIQKEIDIISAKVYKLGFIESQNSVIKKVSDSFFQTQFNLGRKFLHLKINYNSKMIPTETIKLVSENVTDSYFILPFNSIESSLEFINLKISEQGYPFNEIRLSNITKSNNGELKADLLTTKSEEKREIDKIIVKGYENFPKSFLKHYLKLKKGDVLNLSEIKNKTTLLQELQFANQIKEPEILFSKDSTILYVYIDKNRSNTFDGFLGFGTNEETSNLELNGYLNLELINNLNFGESLSLIYRSDESDQKTFNVKIATPYIFNSPIGIDLELKIFKRDTSFTTVNQNLHVSYILNPKNKFSLGYKSTQSTNLLDDNSDPFIQDYNNNIYNVRYEFVSRRNTSRLFRKNTLIDFEAGAGKRKLENSNTNQIHLFLNAFKIFNLNNKNSIYLRAQGFNLVSDNYLENELAFFGGINSIRGFEENSLNASLYTFLNTEYRYLLSNGLYVHSIIDVAYFENEIVNQKEKLYSFGFGFGLLTKAGLLRFNYANGKSENQSFKFSNSQIHISLSAIF